MIEDNNGQTAAHRFFGRAPRSLLSWLRAEVMLPVHRNAGIRLHAAKITTSISSPLFDGTPRR